VATAVMFTAEEPPKGRSRSADCIQGRWYMELVSGSGSSHVARTPLVTINAVARIRAMRPTKRNWSALGRLLGAGICLSLG
jgi:hypothetical protein